MAELLLKLLFLFVGASVPIAVDHQVVEPMAVEVEAVKRDPDLTIQVDAEGKFSCDGKVVDGEGLAELLKAKKQEKDDLMVGIKAHDEVGHDKIVELLKVATEAGIDQLSFIEGDQ